MTCSLPQISVNVILSDEAHHEVCMVTTGYLAVD